MSKKQYAQLFWATTTKEKTIGIFDKNRFVWAGIESDKERLQKHFKAEWQDLFEISETRIHHVPKPINPIDSEPNEKLLR